MVACLMVMLPAMAGSGYLSTVGPIPLRLSATAGARPDVAAVLPPLDPPRSLPPISEPTKALIDPTASQNSLKISPSEKAPAELIWFGPPLPVEMIGPPLPQATVSEERPVSSSAGERGAITAALLRFFQPGGTPQTSRNVLIPVGFSPPQPALVPSSAASYNQSP